MLNDRPEKAEARFVPKTTGTPRVSEPEWLYLLVEAGALVPAGAFEPPLSQPASAKQATSASNENNFIVMCIIFVSFALSLPGRLALSKLTKNPELAKH
jgi:hypothetical protein